MKAVVGFAKDESGLVLNDVVIDRGLSSHMAKLDLYVNESLVTTVTGDGLILATSTGSTAYSAGMLRHAFTPYGNSTNAPKKRFFEEKFDSTASANSKSFLKYTLAFHVLKSL